MKSKRGVFISFEGIDGSGKSTQILHLKSMLEGKGFSVIFVREPGGTLVSERIRPILLDKGSAGMKPEAELLLFEAARAQIVREVIEPALFRGEIVICDRFFDSTVAYQGYARGIDLDTIHKLNDFATGGLEPDITFLLDLPVEDAVKRQGKRGEKDRMELEGVAFMQKVRDGFLTHASSKDRMVVLDARNEEMVLAQTIENKFWEVVDI